MAVCFFTVPPPPLIQQCYISLPHPLSFQQQIVGMNKERPNIFIVAPSVSSKGVCADSVTDVLHIVIPSVLSSTPAPDV